MVQANTSRGHGGQEMADREGVTQRDVANRYLRKLVEPQGEGRGAGCGRAGEREGCGSANQGGVGILLLDVEDPIEERAVDAAVHGVFGGAAVGGDFRGHGLAEKVG